MELYGPRGRIPAEQHRLADNYDRRSFISFILNDVLGISLMLTGVALLLFTWTQFTLAVSIAATAVCGVSAAMCVILGFSWVPVGLNLNPFDLHKRSRASGGALYTLQ